MSPKIWECILKSAPKTGRNLFCKKDSFLQENGKTVEKGLSCGCKKDSNILVIGKTSETGIPHGCKKENFLHVIGIPHEKSTGNMPELKANRPPLIRIRSGSDPKMRLWYTKAYLATTLFLDWKSDRLAP